MSEIECLTLTKVLFMPIAFTVTFWFWETVRKEGSGLIHRLRFRQGFGEPKP
jgi:hypothetical protein